MQETSSQGSAPINEDCSLALQNVTKTFGGQVVLKDVTLSLPTNSFCAIMGPSGCGKSTLLNLIAGLDSCSSGSVTVMNTQMNKLSGPQRDNFRLQNLAFIFQFFNLLPTLNVLENVCLTAFEQKRTPKSEVVKQATELLDHLGLHNALHKLPAELSGGMQARASFARALVSKPKIILADEPTGSLDSASGAALMDSLTQYHKISGCTVVLVTHDAAAAKCAQRVIFMRDGQLV